MEENKTFKRKNYRRNNRRRFFVEWTLAEDVLLENGETPEKFGPECKTSGSAGYDLKAVFAGSIEPGQFIPLIPLGVKMKIPFGFEGQLRPRSGLGSKGLTITNTPGTIDSDYRGEIKVNFYNAGKETITWERGDRIAQIVFSKVYKGLKFMPDGLSEDKFVNERGSDGHGSTGMSSDKKE